MKYVKSISPAIAILSFLASAWAQPSTTELPPQIIAAELSINGVVEAGNPLIGDTFFSTEGDRISIQLDIQVPSADESGEGSTEEVELYYEKISTGITFSEGFPLPAPPLAGDTQRNVFKPLALEDLGNDVYRTTLSWTIPDFNGANQARLRGLIDYDVQWFIRIGVWDSESATDEDPVSRIGFFLKAIENLARRARNNPPPVADAGGDTVVATGATVILDGRGSFDGTNVGFDAQDPNVFEKDTLRYTWEWVSGPERVDPEPFDDGDPATDQVTLELISQSSDPYVYRLVVEDFVNPTYPISINTTRIHVRASLPGNIAPLASVVGPSGAVTVGSTVTLDASGSTDPDGDLLNYLWQRTNELGGELEGDQIREDFQPIFGRESEVATWQALTPGRYYFRLTVTDRPILRDLTLEGQQLTDTASLSIEVIEPSASGQTAGIQTGDGFGQLSPMLPAGACGAGLMPLAVVPLVLCFARGRRQVP
jgi:hypothetical protein